MVALAKRHQRGSRRNFGRVRRPWLLTGLLGLACLALCGEAFGSGSAGSRGRLPAAPIPWPDTRLQLGLADAPGGAGALVATAPLALRYQYLAGGVNTGNDWTHWDPHGSFVSDYIAESEAHHLIPVFSYYELRQSLPGAGNSDEPSADLGNLDDMATMRAYYLTLSSFYRRAASATGPVVLQLEPDLFGYIEQRATRGDASTVPAAVASTGLSELRGIPNTAAGFAQAVLVLRHDLAPRVIVGYPISVWGTGKDIHLSHPSSPEVDVMAAAAVAFYRSLHADFDVTFTELTDRDAGYAQIVNGESAAVWWKTVDFDHDLRFLADYHERVALPIVMWQIPLGNTVSPVVNNTPYHYRDNKVQWLLGQGTRAHQRAFVRAGGVALLFGGGQAQDTDAGNASGDAQPDDGGYFDARARAYYRAGALALPRPPTGTRAAQRFGAADR
jgi:hypothetical protein